MINIVMCSATSSSKVHSCTRLGTETVTFNLSISELRFTWLAICSHYAMLTIGIHQMRGELGKMHRAISHLTKAAFEKSCRLIRLIWSPLLSFVYSIVSIRSIWICVRLLNRDYSEHDLSARSPDFERSDFTDGGRKWLCFTCRWNNNVFHRQVRKCKI